MSQEEEPFASATRLALRLRISRDRATILLIRNQWDEHKFTLNYVMSQDYDSLSGYIVNQTQHGISMTTCIDCGVIDLCQNIGCGHYFCKIFFIGSIESRVLEGNPTPLCPLASCGKYLSHSVLTRHLSSAALAKYTTLLKQSYEPITVDNRFVTRLSNSTSLAYSFLRERIMRYSTLGSRMIERGDNLEAANASITRLALRLGISRDNATILLIKNQWDEQKFTPTFFLSAEYASLSSKFMNLPLFDVLMTSCFRCHVIDLSGNFGCGDYLCSVCFIERIESKVIAGDLTPTCPYPRCGKFLPPSVLTRQLSSAALTKYKSLMKESYESITNRFGTRLFNTISALMTRVIGDNFEVLKNELMIIAVRTAWDYVRHL